LLEPSPILIPQYSPATRYETPDTISAPGG
jgi:hypothetical protein